MCGSNRFGQLGLGKDVMKSSIPIKLDCFPHKIQYIATKNCLTVSTYIHSAISKILRLIFIIFIFVHVGCVFGVGQVLRVGCEPRTD